MTATTGVLVLVAAWMAGVLLSAEARRRVVTGYGREQLPRLLVLRAQLVGTALNRIVPCGGGLVSAHGRLLARRGHSKEVIGACLGGYAAAGVLAHAALCSTAVAVMAPAGVLPRSSSLGHAAEAVVLAAAGVALLLAASVWLHPTTRRWLSRAVLALRSALQTVRRDPLTFLQVAALQVLAQVVVVVALLGALLATGTRVPYLSVLAMALLATALASLVPAPAGAGPTEAGLIGGLLLLGVGPGPATAGVALFRLVTHWLPVPLGAALATPELLELLRLRRARRARDREDELALGRASRPRTLATVD